MKQIIRKPLAILLCVVMLMGALPFGVLAAKPTSGKIGKNATWSYDSESNTLTISGTGKASDQDYQKSWYACEECMYEDKEKENSEDDFKISLVVEEGITELQLDAYDMFFRSIKLPDTLKKIDGFRNCDVPSTITIPRSVTSITPGSFSAESFKAYKVASGNQAFSVKDGVLFNKDKSVLISYPCDKKGKSYVIPGSVTRIREGAFNDLLHLEKLTIPKSVNRIDNSAFYADAFKAIYFKGTPKMKYPMGDEFTATIYYPKKQKKAWKKLLKQLKKALDDPGDVKAKAY